MADAKQLAEALAEVVAAFPWDDMNAEQASAINQARQALAAFEAQAAMSPKQTSGTLEPVAWRILIGDSDIWGYASSESDADFYGRQSGLRYVKQALYAAPVAQAEPWQPIETAPKDGTNVLLLNRKRNVAAGLWMDSASGSGWYLRGGSLGPDVFFNNHHGPTHWMPLPQPPKENP